MSLDLSDTAVDDSDLERLKALVGLRQLNLAKTARHGRGPGVCRRFNRAATTRSGWGRHSRSRAHAFAEACGTY